MTVRRPPTALHFESSKLGGNEWARVPAVAKVARFMASSRRLYREILDLCQMYGNTFGYRDAFLAELRKTLGFIRPNEIDNVGRDELLAAFEEISQNYGAELSKGVEPYLLNGWVLSALCECVTEQLLLKCTRYDSIVRDAQARVGPNPILPNNSANLDFAACLTICRDTYWFILECKQDPAQFFEPYLWRDELDPNRKDRWTKSQIRLALKILEFGTEKFVAVAVISYRPAPDVQKKLRRLDPTNLPIQIYDRNRAWDCVPWSPF